MAVDGGRKKDKRGAPSGPDLQLLGLLGGASGSGGGVIVAIVAIVVIVTVLLLIILIIILILRRPRQMRKGRVPTAGNIVEVHQDGDGPLSPVGRKPGPVGLVQIKGIVMGEILLGGQIPSHLREFHVTNRLTSERLDLAAERGNVLPGQIAARGCPGGADDPLPVADDGGRGEGIGGNVDEVVAFLVRQKVFDLVDGRVAMDLLEARIKHIDAVEDGDGSTVLLLLLLMVFIMFMFIMLLLLLMFGIVIPLVVVVVE